MNSDRPAATARQLALMRDLGLVPPQTCTLAQAAEAIALAQIIHCFATQIAQQEWRQDLTERDIRPLVKTVLEKPGMAEQIRDIMDANAQAAWTAQTEHESGLHKAVKIERRDVTPDLREDGNYLFVKMRLEKLFTDLPAYAPPKMQAVGQARVFLARDETLTERVKTWVNELLG